MLQKILHFMVWGLVRQEVKGGNEGPGAIRVCEKLREKRGFYKVLLMYRALIQIQITQILLWNYELSAEQREE